MSILSDEIHPGVFVSVQVKVYVPAVVAVAVDVAEVALPKTIPTGPVHAPVPILGVAFKL